MRVVASLFIFSSLLIAAVWNVEVDSISVEDGQLAQLEVSRADGTRWRLESPAQLEEIDPVQEATAGPDAPGDLDELYEPMADCRDGDVTPLGQDPSARGFEPLGPIWCFDLNEPPDPTRMEGENSWIDDFDFCETTPCHTMASFDDSDLDYRLFENAGQNPGRSQHWLNQNHWMVDVRGAHQGGATMRPNRPFRFEDGKMVVEADVAAGMPEYGDSGDTWVELTVTSAPAPTRDNPFPDALYAYGQFPGHTSVGCRLQASRIPVCAVYGPTVDTPPGDGLCHEIDENWRTVEVAFWQHCGESYGGGPFSTDTLQRWRACDRQGPDMACRDRFRMEVEKDAIRLYVNGKLYFQDSGWPASHQLPDDFLNGNVYTYASDWQVRNGDSPSNRSDGETYRYHWDRIAINPDTGPSPAPSFNQ